MEVSRTDPQFSVDQSALEGLSDAFVAEYEKLIRTVDQLRLILTDVLEGALPKDGSEGMTGTLSVTNGSIGIDTSTPDAKITLQALALTGIHEMLSIKNANGDQRGSLQYDADNVHWRFADRNGNAYFILVETSGQIRLPNLAPNQDVQTDGSKNLISVSDERLKDIFAPPEYGLKEILQIKPIRFRFKHDPKEGQLVIGFSAQNVEKVIPECVTEDVEGFKGVNSRGIIAALVKATHELSARVEQLESRSVTQQGLIDKLTARMAVLESPI